MNAKVLASIEEGRRMMGLDLLVRTSSGNIATEKNCGVIELYRMVRLDSSWIKNVVSEILVVKLIASRTRQTQCARKLLDNSSTQPTEVAH